MVCHQQVREASEALGEGNVRRESRLQQVERKQADRTKRSWGNGGHERIVSVLIPWVRCLVFQGTFGIIDNAPNNSFRA